MTEATKATKAERVLRELKRRGKAGHPLNSGANRGDWLYAAALLSFGSWRKAVESAGIDYDAIKIRPFTKDEVIARLKQIAESGDPILARAEEPKLVSAANRHFGSWRDATDAAGGVPGPTKWTPQRVLEAIRVDQAAGLPVNSVAMVRRNKNLYAAGRRRFGTWAAALEAASGRPDPIVEMLRAEKARRRPMTSAAVQRRNGELHRSVEARFGSWEAGLRAAFGPGGQAPAEVKASAPSRRRR